MENKKLNLAELKAKANNVATVDALNAIKGGVDAACHDGKCTTTIIGGSATTYGTTPR